MPRDPQEPTIYDLLPTDDLAQRVVRLWVPATKVRNDLAMTRGVTLDAFSQTTGAQTDGLIDMGYGKHVLTAPGPVGDGYLSFLFAPPSPVTADTDVSLHTPWQENTIWVNDFEWPDVLHWLLASRGYATAELESGLVGTNATSNTKKVLEVLDQWELVQGGRMPTQVLVQDYLTPYQLTGINVITLKPDSVRYRFLGMTNNLLCLHDDVTVPSLLAAPSLLAGFGTPNAQQIASDNGGGQFFPGTPFKTWITHTYRVDQSPDPVDGLYKTRLWTAYPPSMPKGQTLAG